MLLMKGFSLTLKWFARVGLIILQGMVEVVIRKSFKDASRTRSNSGEECGNTTRPTIVGGGVEVGPEHTSGPPRKSLKKSKNSIKMED